MSYPLALATRPPLVVVRKSLSVRETRTGKFVRVVPEMALTFVWSIVNALRFTHVPELLNHPVAYA